MPRKAASPAKPETEIDIKTAQTAVVSRQFFEGKSPTAPEDTKNEVIEILRFLTEPAKVSVSMGLTLNLGNYESARIDVALVVPCYREEVDAAYKYANKWVEDRLGTEVQNIRKNKPNLF